MRRWWTTRAEEEEMLQCFTLLIILIQFKGRNKSILCLVLFLSFIYLHTLSVNLFSLSLLHLSSYINTYRERRAEGWVYTYPYYPRFAPTLAPQLQEFKLHYV